MHDPWKWLKRIGRSWCLLTHEDQEADPDAIREILIVATAADRHATAAVAQARVRFPDALVRTIGDQATTWWRVLRLLQRWRGEQLSAVVLLSLNPVLVAAVCAWFPCYKLLYNRWGEWFLIRRKTLREWLVGRRGADDRRYDWPPETGWRRAAERLARWLLAGPRLIVQGVRAVRLMLWIAWRIGRLMWRRFRSVHWESGRWAPGRTS